MLLKTTIRLFSYLYTLMPVSNDMKIENKIEKIQIKKKSEDWGWKILFGERNDYI